MPAFHSDLAACAVPRYTSYPTAASFTADVGAANQAEALAKIGPATTVSLYLHVPYCHQICWYCGCNTGAVGRADRLEAYIAALIDEIHLVGERIAGPVTRVHFGGGSPNALPSRQFAAICDAVRTAFRVDAAAEWAVELDPRGLNREYAEDLATCGITRASLGAQTFSPAVQAQINRIQPFRQVAFRAAELRHAGIARVSLDLMYGLPAQTLDDVASSITRARLIAPDRVAMFGYAHLPQALPRQRMINPARLPGPAARFAQSLLARDLLIEQGMVEIGFDHFARADDTLARAAATGTLHRNFQGFTDDDADVVIGLGASAISSLPGLIVQNEKHVGAYRQIVAGRELPGRRGVAVAPEDRARAWVIERLLCDGAVDLGVAAARFALPGLLDLAGHSRLSELVLRDLIRIDGSRIVVTDEGRPYARVAASAFDRHAPALGPCFSKAV